MKESKYLKAATNVAQVVEEKQVAYGDSFGKAGKVLELLYPNGVKIEQYQDMLTVVRIIDKIFRIASKKDAFGESPYSDLMGYSLLGLVKSEKNDGMD